MNTFTEHQMAATNVPGGPPKPRILVVDDDHLLRELHAAILHLEGYSVETAEHGAEALRRLAAKPFDLVITDRNMPHLDGVGLIRKIRASGNPIPIVMVSGSLADSELPVDVAREVSVALPKPALPAQVLAAASFALRHPPAKRPVKSDACYDTSSAGLYQSAA
jgi:CheY-like chemotaxis protein